MQIVANGLWEPKVRDAAQLLTVGGAASATFDAVIPF